MNWNGLESKRLVSPFIPNESEDNFDSRIQSLNDP